MLQYVQDAERRASPAADCYDSDFGGLYDPSRFVCAPRRLCAPSFLLLNSLPLTASLAFSLLLAAPDAHAGSYSTPVYSGGTYTGLGGQYGAPGTYNDSGSSASTTSSSGYGASASVGGGSASCQKAISATLTWQPAYSGEPAPSSTSVIVTETATASSQTLAAGSDTAKCDDGLNEPGSQQSAPGVAQYSSGPNPQVTGYFAQASVTNTRYTANGGSSISLSDTPTGSVSGSGAESSAASVHYTVSASPVIIGFAGATSDGQGGWDILVGQKCAPYLDGIPSDCTVSNYQWSVTGTTMQSWTVSSDSTHTMEVDGSGNLNIESPAWFWNDASQTSETITCTATVTPPTGEGNPFTVTASQTVGVYLPSWSASGIGGQMMIDTNYPDASNNHYWLYAAPSAGSTYQYGMVWLATLAPPQNAPVQFDEGNIYFVQVVTPSEECIDFSNQEYKDEFYEQTGLDETWPYGWLGGYEDPPTHPSYVTYDYPGFDVTNDIYASEMSSFEDWIMYQPYGSSEYVPLGYYKWNVNSGNTIPSTNNWGDFKNPSGIVEPSGNPVNFTPSNGYPSWSQNVVKDVFVPTQ